ncbi:MAG: GAF domain-containing sensor histidine kinase [Longimicrobiales bacterium]
MDLTVPLAAASELAPAYLQFAVTVGLVVLCGLLYRRYRKDYFGLWALAWSVYALRLGAIIRFLHTEEPAWLYWHQVTTGWTALALLWAALVFSRRLEFRPWFFALALFPPVWSYLAIYRLDSFLLAAGPAVAFLSVATAWTAWAFFRYDRDVGSPAARVLAAALLLWALHHLDYPFLRGRGIWNPWGYYLDILFQLGTGTGILLLVLEDLDQGLRTLSALSGELQQRGRRRESVPEAVLRRALGLRGVHGSALYLVSAADPDADAGSPENGEPPERARGAFVHGAGVAALWPYEAPPGPAREAVDRVRSSGRPEVVTGARTGDDRTWAHPYTAALPVLRGDRVAGALVVVGEARDPFTALDAPFLRAFGAQVGAALENEDLYLDLENRTEELERVQARMVRQHEEERNRLSRELHDETAQVLAAVNMQLGLLRERGDEAMAASLDRARALVGEGIKSIRSVTRNLRPTVLDDLGLLPALRALIRDFGGDSALEIAFHAPLRLPPVGADAELALFRTLQEALANAVRHGACREVSVVVDAGEASLVLVVHDDGTGFPVDDAGVLNRTRGGLAGIRERIAAVGGAFTLDNHPGGGARVRVEVPRSDRPTPTEGDPS